MAEKDLQRIHFKPLDENLTFGNVVDLCRDHRGYLWIGNYDMGVTRYDGYETIEYKSNPNDDDTLTNSFVTCLLEDSDFNIWVGTRNGLNRYVPQTDSFQRYFYEENEAYSLADNRIYGIYEDLEQRLWIVSRTSIHLYHPETDQFERFGNPDLEKSAGSFCGITMDQQGELWVVSTQPGIYHFDPNTGDFSFFEDSDSEPKERGIKRTIVDSFGTIWIGTEGKNLQSFDKTSGTFTSYPANGHGTGTSGTQIWDLIEYPKGQLLLGINQGGINRLDLTTGTFSYQSTNDTLPGRLSGDGVVSLLHDYESILWVGTSRSGIDYFNPKMQRFHAMTKSDSVNSIGLVGNEVGCIYEDTEGLFWIGSDGNGVTIWDPEQYKTLPIAYPEDDDLLVSGVIRSISQDSKGRYWINSWRKGIVILEKQGETLTRFRGLDEQLAALPGLLCWSHIVDSKDRVWVTSQKGDVYLFDIELNQLGHFFESHWDEIDDLPILYEKDGEVYLSHSYGFYKFDSESNAFEKLVETAHANITKFDGNAYYYTGTATQGLAIYNIEGDQVGLLGEKDGLSDLFVSSIEFSKDGKVWFGTNRGLNVYDPNSGEITHYDKYDGLPGNQFFVQSSLEATSGELWFGGLRGLIHFDPLSISPNAFIPQVFVYEILINNELIDFRDEAAPFSQHPQTLDSFELKWHENSIKFRFGAVNLTASLKNQYEYQLVGWDKNWIKTDPVNRMASYTNLAPGAYTFKVRASNNDGVWNEEGSSITFVIHPPFWRTPWFYTAIGVSLFFMIYQFIIFREKRLVESRYKLELAVKERTQTIERQKNELELQGRELLKHQNQLEETVVERTKDLIVARDRAEKSDRLKTSFLANMSHEIRTPLNAIVGLSSFMSDKSIDDAEREEFAAAIRSNSDSLLGLIEDILDFSMIENGQLKLLSEEFDLNQLLEVLHASHSSHLPHSKLKLTVENPFADQSLRMLSDPFRLKQILDNLIGNALKFSKEGEVRLGVSKTENEFQFFVSDNGPGIPEANLQNIFREFEKLEKHQTEAVRGVGLGLAISKRLAGLLEAKLEVTSVLGKGSTFTLTFAGSVAVSKKQSEKPAITNGNMPESLEEKSYLIIEDEHSNYQYLSEILKRLGAKVAYAENGETGVQLVEENEYDLIFLDIKMPGIDGFETLKKIRSLKKHIPVVAQTAFALLEDRKKIERAGFNDALWKPIPIQDIYRVVSKFA